MKTAIPTKIIAIERCDRAHRLTRTEGLDWELVARLASQANQTGDWFALTIIDCREVAP